MFAVTHNVVFNVTKSQCMIINSKFDLIHHPTFHLNGSTLPYTEKYKYLGHTINPTLTDDDDVLRQTNKITRSFSFASLSVKLALFKHIVCQFMDVSFGVGCFSTQIENCRLRTMTLSDNCCVN